VHDWFAQLWRNFAYTPLANLCGTPAMGMQEGGRRGRRRRARRGGLRGSRDPTLRIGAVRP
jgi:hypothetical protein